MILAPTSEKALTQEAGFPGTRESRQPGFKVTRKHALIGGAGRRLGEVAREGYVTDRSAKTYRSRRSTPKTHRAPRRQAKE